MNNFYNSLGLVGTGGYSAGCGILTSFNGNSCILTAQHIIDELTGSPWFQFGLRKTRFPAEGFIRYPLSFNRAFPLVDAALLDIGLVPGEYLTFEGITLAPGDPLYVYGYPVNETIEAILQNRDEPLLPIRTAGIFSGYSENVTLKRDKVSKPPIIVNSIGLIQMERSDFEGYSGGLVTTGDNRPVGLIVGEINRGLMFIPVKS